MIGKNCKTTDVSKAPTDAKHFDACDGRAKLNAFGGGGKVTTWKAGSTQKVAWSVATPHGGYVSYAMCPVEKMGKDYHRAGATDTCFRNNRLKFANNMTCPIIGFPDDYKNWPGHKCFEAKMFDAYWKEDWPRGKDHDRKKYYTMGVQSEVEVPSNLKDGRYVLQWSWDTEGGGQIWQSCADIEITGGSGPSPAPTPVPEPPSPAPTPVPEPVGACVFQDGGTADKNMIAGVDNIHSEQACCDECVANADCTHFTWVTKKNSCNLRSGSPEYNDVANHVSGEVRRALQV